MARRTVANTAQNQPDDLFLNLAEQVKLPLVQIAHAAEILGLGNDLALQEQARHTIALTSQAALQLIDGYLLSVELQRQGQLELEPVSLSSVLYDTAEDLQAYARAHDCTLEIRLAGKYGPVMAHKKAVQAALTGLGLSFIEASAGQKQPVVRLTIKRQGEGVATGVFSNKATISTAVLAAGRNLQGKVHQPLGAFDSGNGSGVFIADSLFSQLQTEMKPMRLKDWNGLAAVLKPSGQLSLV